MKYLTWDLPYDEDSIEVWVEKMFKDQAAVDRLLDDLDDLDDLPLVSIGPSGIGGPYQREYYGKKK